MKGIRMYFFKRHYLYKCLTALFIIPFFFGFSSGNNGLNIITNGNQKYLANTIIVKLKEAPLTGVDGKTEMPSAINSYMKKFDYSSATALFPNKKNDNGFGLNRIVMIKYNSGNDPYFISSKLKNIPGVEWAEPKFVYDIEYTVNDPDTGLQWNLTKIKASLGWDVTTGDTSIVIGIVDTGVDWDHPDLAANIWRNWDETLDNSDDDGNGKVDDIRGWDFAGSDGNSPDNNPMEDVPTHGTHVAGIASAVTNNGIGIASIGFKCKLLPVKTSAGGSTSILYGYEGIVYAVDKGAKVINCSWGGYGYSIFGQVIIDYAISKGALIVAAAGNENTSDLHYPSSYDGVLSVASTTSSDTKSSFSDYGTTIDVSAPGSNIYSTWMNDTYTYLNGTSMASPLAAGLAALVCAHFPGYNPLQVAEQIRVNSDNIDNINPGYTNLLGSGRLNAQRTLTNTSSISVRAVSFKFSDDAPGGDGDGIFEPGETISLADTFVNYLNPVTDLQITLENKNGSYVSMVQDQFPAGSHGTLETFDNNNEGKFYFTLSNSLPQNTNLRFLLHFSDGSYSDYQWASTIGNPTYNTQSGNDVSLTITSKGALSYNDFPNNSQGNGCTYLDGQNLLFEGALILATSSTQVSDVARGTGTGQNSDFTVVQPFVLNTPGTIADQQGSATFNDDAAGSNKIGTTIKLESFSFADPPDNNYIILKYNIINNNNTPITGIYAGLFFDWDIIDGSGAGDKTTYDAQGNLSYTYNTTGGPDTWVTTALISSDKYSFYAIDNDGTAGGFGVNDDNGFTDAEKWQALSNGISKSTAGPTDISHVIGGGPFNISPGDTIDVGFVIGAGLTLEDLRTIVSNARAKYAEILVTDVEENKPTSPTEFSLAQNYPNPFNPTTKIKYSIPSTGTSSLSTSGGMKFIQLKVYDILGNEVATLVNEEKPAGEYEVEFNASKLPSGIYFYRLKAGNFIQTKKMILIK